MTQITLRFVIVQCGLLPEGRGIARLRLGRSSKSSDAGRRPLRPACGRARPWCAGGAFSELAIGADVVQRDFGN